MGRIMWQFSLFLIFPLSVFAQVNLIGNQDQSLRGIISDLKNSSITITSQPQHGKFSIKTTGNYSYDPALNYVGKDMVHLSYSSNGSTINLTINIDIKATNHRPDYKTPFYNNYYYRETSNFFRVKKNTALNSSIFGIVDSDGDPITYSVLTSPTKGTLQLNSDGSFSYTPNSNTEGWDKFTFKISDGKGGINQKMATLFIYPGKDEILNKLDASATASVHPRVIFNQTKLLAAQNRGPRIIQVSVDKMVELTKSNPLFNQPVRDYSSGATRATAIGDWLRILSVSSVLANNQADIEEIFSKAVIELMAVCNAPNWGTANSLDVSEMTYQVAIAYSLMYSKLNDNQRILVRTNLIKKGLNFLLGDFNTTNIWHAEATNWNFLNNSSALMGAMAIWNEPTDAAYNYRDIAGQIMENYFKSIPLAYTRFTPGGGWFEGPGYCYWMMRLESYSNATLINTIGTDYGLRKAPGFDKLGYYILHQNGPKGMFNVADEGDPSNGSSTLPEVALFSGQLYNQQDLGYYFYKTNYRFDLSTLANYDVSFQTASINSQDPDAQDYYAEGAEFFFSRKNMLATSGTAIDLNTSYVAFKAGQNTDWHAALDIGNFVFDAYGERWIRDIGGDSYTIKDYGAKQTTYRKRAEGQNTLVINPSTAIDQSFAWEKISRFETSTKKSFAIAEMSSTYKYHAYSVQRGIMFDKSAQNLLVQDEIHTRGASDIYSFMHTKAAISVNGTGSKATFTIGTKKMVAYLLSPAKAKFTIMDAKALPESQPIMASGQNTNTGYRKLCVNLKDSTDIRLSVWLVPFSATSDPEPTTMPLLKPLSEWTLDDTKTPTQLAASANNSVVNLSWTSVYQATGYNLYKSVTGIDGVYQLINSEPVTSPSATDNTLLSGKAHYKVSALFIGKEYATINPIEVSLTTPVPIMREMLEFSFYPNPAKNTLNLNFSKNGNYLIRFYDMASNLKMEKSIYSDHGHIDISSLAKGLYLIEVKTNTRLQTVKKLIIL